MSQDYEFINKGFNENINYSENQILCCIHERKVWRQSLKKDGLRIKVLFGYIGFYTLLEILMELCGKQ